MQLSLSIDNVERKVTLEKKGDTYVITVEGRSYVASGASISDGVLNFFVGKKTFRAFVSKNILGTQITLNGRDYFLRGHDGEEETGERFHYVGDGAVEAPMPGSIVVVNVKQGDQVNRGDTVVVLEAMKMQNEITSPVQGTVQQVNCEPGDQVGFGDVLAEIKPEG
ncbi:MAG: biotin/lipoyl-binding protein [Candidatus Krumholzibacteria bacterium]|nr:biotin/lipoyl-binding protein [Candidatus Krumholzibacteria bacterium]